jgi:hypothetical protein
MFDGFASIQVPPDEKDLQIARLRQQLCILERHVKTKQRLSLPEKLMQVTLATRLNVRMQRFLEGFCQTVCLVKPEAWLK